MNAPDSILAPDLDEAQRFLDTLDPAAERWTFQTFDDDIERRKARQARDESDPFARVMHGSLSEAAPTLQRLQQQGAGVYVTVNETDFQGRRGDNIVRVRACFLDLHGAPLVFRV